MVKILLVDDSAFMRKIERNILEKNEYKDIIEASGGKQALLKFKEEKPDLVLLDIIMPDVGGIDALRDMKKINPKAKVIMVTAVGQEAIVEECNQLGAVGYIVKPFEEEKVMELIESVLDSIK